MLVKIFFALLFLSTMIFAQTQPPPLEPGVSQDLAKWRAANYSDVRYKLNITLEKGAPLMRGEIEIRVNLTDDGAKNNLILDWRTTQFANDKDKSFADVVAVNDAVEIQGNTAAVILASESNEHLIVPKALLKPGENIIKIRFASPIKTSGAAITRYVDKEDGAEYVYSLFVPSDASTAFPVFDQPDLKARFQLDIYSPIGWKVVSNNNAFVFETSLQIHNTKIDIPEGKALNRFIETKPISTYVFAFAAGDFAEFKEKTQADIDKQVSEQRKTNPIFSVFDQPSDFYGSRIFVRRSQAEKFKQHAAEVFRLNREGVKFLESYFDYKFPFPKYDLVLIPEFPFGGMEHAGATFLREDRVIFPTEPTKNDYITRANVIFHEAAHQWFGDTVTMRWFDDLWLKEGFAEFMAYKTMEKVLPEYNAWKIFYERNKQAAYLTDSTKGTTPIYQEIPNLSAAKSAYGNIVYRKAPSFLRQAEFYLGEDKFQIAVRAFLKKHEFANAEWTDLVKEFETASKQDLKFWAENWVKDGGATTIKIGKKYPDKKQLYGFFSQKDISGEYTCRRMKFNLYVKYENGKTDNNKVWIACGDNLPPNAIEDVNGIYLDPKKKFGNPALIFPNYQDYGYGIFLLDERSRAYVLENIQTEKDDFLRTMMWGALWDSVRETELAPQDYVKLVVKNINVESDESTINTLLGRVSTAMNYYLSDRQRDALAPNVETLLIDKMQNAPTLGQRITFYRAFVNLASTDKARMILKDVLGGKLTIKDLQLKSKDRFDIAAKLLILNDADAPRLLAALEKTETTDEAKRYAYAAKAGIATAENKAKFWNDFVNNKEISESYIESAFVAFNAPKHADLTLPYLEKALTELPNLKKNRKIFFINGWLAAFIGGQKSEEALKIVNKFLADNPNIDKDLRLKILENSDNLERSVKIRAKYGEK